MIMCGRKFRAHICLSSDQSYLDSVSLVLRYCTMPLLIMYLKQSVACRCAKKMLNQISSALLRTGQVYKRTVPQKVRQNVTHIRSSISAILRNSIDSASLSSTLQTTATCPRYYLSRSSLSAFALRHLLVSGVHLPELDHLDHISSQIEQLLGQLARPTPQESRFPLVAPSTQAQIQGPSTTVRLHTRMACIAKATIK